MSALFIGLTGTHPACAGTIVNGDFEIGTTDSWTFTSGSGAFYVGVPWSASTEAAHSGTYGAVADGNWAMKQTFTGVPVTDIESLAFWLRRPIANTSDSSQIQILTTLFYSDNTMSWFISAINSNNWVQFDVTGSLNSTKTLTGMDAWGYVACAGLTSAECNQRGPFTTYIDDVKLTRISDPPEPSDIPEPSMMHLLGIGLVGVAMVARRKRRGI